MLPDFPKINLTSDSGTLTARSLCHGKQTNYHCFFYWAGFRFAAVIGTVFKLMLPMINRVKPRFSFVQKKFR